MSRSQYMIERHSSDGTYFWSGDAWSESALDGVMFPRKEGAEFCAQRLRMDHWRNIRVEEHIFL